MPTTSLSESGMDNALRSRIAVPLLLLLMALFATPALAQVDLSGAWTPRYHEDQPERIPGPELADYLGLPINEEARQWALSWDPSRLTVQEHQCQVHTVAYIYRGPLQVRIWEGRPHPPDYAAHTWMGFSTGKWEGDTLTVTTTHIKQGWHRRNGLPSSDQITLTEHFIRHGNYLTHVSVVNDPIFLAEPLIKSQNFVLNDTAGGNWLWPCEYVEEIADRPAGAVPHYMPGENPFVNEFVNRHGIPVEAAMGGPETMYPEYQKKLKPLLEKMRAQKK